MKESTTIPAGKKIYFASDFHLGIPDHDSSLTREIKLVNWLNTIEKDAFEIFLMGDIFDFWFEYKTVVPKGYIRLLGKLAQLVDSGIPVHVFRGNHDIWAFDYLQKEAGIVLHRKPELRKYNDNILYLAHGDGMGPGDKGYKFLKKVFECKFCQFLFRWLHPDLGARMALYFSRKSRLANVAKEGKREKMNGIQDEMLFKYSKSLIEEGIIADYYIFGHRHLPVIEQLDDKSSLVILGDWLINFTYAEFDGKKIYLKYYQES